MRREIALFFVFVTLSALWTARALPVVTSELLTFTESTVERESFIGGVGQSVGSGAPPFPYPSPAPNPPTYDFNTTATVLIVGANIQTDNQSQTNDFRADTEIIFGGALQHATVFPDNAPGTYKVVNGTELLSSEQFINFTYYAKPLAFFTATDFPDRRYSLAARLNSPRVVNFSSNALALKQLVAVARGSDFYVAWRAVDPLNETRRPQLQDAFFDFGVMSIQRVPCSNAGITC
ncbi:hypothetical protein F1559_000827 [Cyanidiococcus yangmingshanensis]|uniref:Uncharacterized protein n=1 Tax=Cyanidiococcus yangmingshanensis TaxID=2690220 RepID=A0A7J7IC35_9RHOD|nr:hypothetical protein F1559_000827 [Cyanidiococcus yangmingshanensis]